MKPTMDSKIHRHIINQRKDLDKERYDTCVKEKPRINPIFLRPPYSACEVAKEENRDV